MLPLEKAKRGLYLLKEAGMEKLNFSGGEPFLQPKFMGELARYAKEELELPSVSIVCNGSLLKEFWLKKYGKYIDIIAVSCDSFSASTNKEIGRAPQNTTSDGSAHAENVFQVARLCDRYGILFKINTVVNSKNVDEDMNESISALRPSRWKVFQCLQVEGENAGSDALRSAQEFVVTDDQFDAFLQRHKQRNPVPESNELMRSSYIILDEYMRFLDCAEGAKEPSKSILDVGVDAAMGKSGFDETAFFKRGGKYKWSKTMNSDLDW